MTKNKENKTQLKKDNVSLIETNKNNNSPEFREMVEYYKKKCTFTSKSKIVVLSILGFLLIGGGVGTSIYFGLRSNNGQGEAYSDPRTPEITDANNYELTSIVRSSDGISFKIIAKNGSKEANGAIITIGDKKINNDEFIFTKDKVTILASTLKKYSGHIYVEAVFDDDTMIYFNYHELEVSSDDATPFKIPYVTTGNGKIKWSTTSTHFLTIDENTGVVKLKTEELGGITEIDVKVTATAARNTQDCIIKIIPSVNNFLNFTSVVYENVDAYAVSVKDNAKTELKGTLNIPAYFEGKQVVSVAAHGFENCTELEKVVLPESIFNIGGMAFNGCTKLSEINIPKPTLSFGSKVFTGTAKTLKTVFESKAIWKYTTSSSSGTLDPNTLTSEEMAAEIIKLDDTATSFDKQGIADEDNKLMYYYTTEITASVAPVNDDLEGEVTIPSYVKSDGKTYIIDTIIYNYTTKKSAFSNCQKMTKITLPSTLTTFNVNSFSTCKGLAEIDVDGLNPVFSSLEGVLYTKNLEKLLAYPVAKTTTKFVVPNATKQIANYALANSIYLEEFTYGDNPKLEEIYGFAFAQSNALVTIKLPASLKYFDYYVALSSTKLSTLEFADTTGWSYIEYSYLGTPNLTNSATNAKNAISASYQLCWDGVKK